MSKKMGNGTEEYYEMKRRIEDVADLPLGDRDEKRKQISDMGDEIYGNDNDWQYLKKTYLK